MFIEYFCNRISVFYYAYEFITVVTIPQWNRRPDPARALQLWQGLAGAHLLEAFLIRVGVNGGFDETVRCYFL